MLFVCYAVCRLHPAVSTSEDQAACEESLAGFLPLHASRVCDWEDWAAAIANEMVARRESIPALIADRLGDVIGLDRAKVRRIAEAACSYVNSMQLNDYIDGLDIDNYNPVNLAKEIAVHLERPVFRF